MTTELDREVVEAFDAESTRRVRAMHMEELANWIRTMPNDQVEEHGKIVAAGFLIALYKFWHHGGKVQFIDPPEHGQ